MDQLNRMLESHPNPASHAGEEARACIVAAVECSLVCSTCADACMTGSAAPDDMVECIRLCTDCADVCDTTARVLARAGHRDRGTIDALLEACEAACRACAEECERHQDTLDHCRICAEACRRCEEACERMAGALVA